MAGGREIVFDTETTGFHARGDDRITEIGCVEIDEFLPTGRTFHTYLDPQRDVPAKVTEITGLTREFLTGKPLFKDQAQAFLDFVGDAPLVAHNADFDKAFINAELERAGFAPLPSTQFIDTLVMARRQFPGSPATLDALCKRFDVSLATRQTHGALVDSELLAKVYLELNGGRARKLDIFKSSSGHDKTVEFNAPQRPAPLAPRITADEIAAHKVFVDGELGEKNYWSRLWAKDARS